MLVNLQTSVAEQPRKTEPAAHAFIIYRLFTESLKTINQIAFCRVEI